MSNEIKPGSSLSHLKFNKVGRQEAATEVLTQQIDPATRSRNIIIVVVAVVALAGIVYAGFKETGTKIFSQPKNGKAFEPPSRDMSN